MSSSWTANDWSILLAAIAGLVASSFAGARLSNCVKISLCSDQGWLYIERRLVTPTPGSQPTSILRSNSTPDLEGGMVAV